MKVFKFGGASVKDAASIQNVCSIVASELFDSTQLFIIVSAIGKTTNLLEKLVAAAIVPASAKSAECELFITDVINSHSGIANSLRTAEACSTQLAQAIVSLRAAIGQAPSKSFDQAYDSIVAYGEILSSILLHQALLSASIDAELLPASEWMGTNSDFRCGKVNMPLTTQNLQSLTSRGTAKVFVSQGFIGADSSQNLVTLGREGSDYSAAIVANCLSAASLTIWKDVPGVLSGDPKLFPEATLLPSISYATAAEMTYYGAQVIHPKTLKPLADKGIPLFVRSFVDTTLSGTTISPIPQSPSQAPILILRSGIVLVTVRTTDLSFITEAHTIQILNAAHQADIQILNFQHSALSFSLAFLADFNKAERLLSLLSLLSSVYTVHYNQEGLSLFTIIHGTSATAAQHFAGKEILLEQRTRHTHQIIFRT